MRLDLVLVLCAASWLGGCNGPERSARPASSSDNAREDAGSAAQVPVAAPGPVAAEPACPVPPSPQPATRQADPEPAAVSPSHDAPEPTAASSAPNAAEPPAGPVFFGLPVTGRRVVFTVARTGSMTNSLEDTKTLLRRAVEKLSPEQQFHIIFWTGGPLLEKPGGMVPATPENRKAAIEFIAPVFPVGQTYPELAMRAAFAAKPDVIYALNCGGFPDTMPALVRELNRDRTVAVNVIQLVWPMEERAEWQLEQEKIMETIAEQNGGKYVGVTVHDMRRFLDGTEKMPDKAAPAIVPEPEEPAPDARPQL